MYRPMRGIILAIASVVAGSAVAAQSPSPEPADTMAVPIPGAGVSITLPSDWRIWASTDPDVDGVTASRVITQETCDIALDVDFTTAQAAADDLVSTLDDDFTIVERRPFGAPVGDAVYVSYRAAWLPDEPRYAWHEYRVAVPAGVLSMACSGADPPPDRWMSVIEHLTVAPDQPWVTPDFDPRIDIPEHELAITFPPEWLVRSWPEWPGVVLGGDFVVRAQSAVAGADCWLEDGSRVPGLASRKTPEAWRKVFADAASEGRGRGMPIAPGAHPSDAQVIDDSLSSGPVMRADWQDWGGMPATAWVFQSPGRAVVLFCRASDPPADAWRSIAETFEFLDDEE